MREIRALIWKEWHETRLFLWIAWGLFIGLPIIGGLEGLAMYSHRFQFDASSWIIPFAPVLAVVAGVAATCRDLQPKLEDFWQSRPMGRMRLFIVKFIVGDLVILLSCIAPLIIELAFNRTNADAGVGCWIVPVCLASYGIAVLAGCILRRTAYAAAVALVGLLLLYTLPLIFPALSSFDTKSIFDPLSEPHGFGGPIWTALPVGFAERMLAVAAFTSILGLLAVRFGWHIDSGRPLIYGALSAAFLIVVASASYQLGTNLPILREIDLSLPSRSAVMGVDVDGTGGVAYVTQYGALGDEVQSFTRTLELSGDQVRVGPTVVAREAHEETPSIYTAASERDPEVRYSVIEDSATRADMQVEDLAPLSALGPKTIELWPEKHDNAANIWSSVFLYVHGDRLYACGSRTVVFDITDPLSPKRIFEGPQQWSPYGSGSRDGETFIMRLPPLPDLPAPERLKLALRWNEEYGTAQAFDGTLLCQAGQSREGMLVVMRLKSLTENRAVFDIVAIYKQTLIQSLAGGFGISSLRLSNGFIYATSASAGLVSVYDITGANSIRLVAHFAAPGVDCCQPLPDGRAIAAGDKIWLLGPPPRH